MYELIVGGCSGSNTPAHSRPVYGHLTTSYGLLDRQNKRGIVIDNGTGVQVVAGEMLKAGVMKSTILQTHFHADHLEGLQLNGILFKKTVESSFHVPKFENGKPFVQSFDERFHPTTWPVSPATFDSHPGFQVFNGTSSESWKIGEVEVRTLPLNHPGGCVGYRFVLPEGDIVIATDNELVGKDFCKRYGEFVSGAKILIADVQYTQEEYEGKTPLGGQEMPRKNWGHSTPEMLNNVLFAYCDVWPRNIFLTHHDPSRTDDELKEFATDAQAVNSKFQLLEPSH